jgi:hypothetical protein
MEEHHARETIHVPQVLCSLERAAKHMGRVKFLNFVALTYKASCLNSSKVQFLHLLCEAPNPKDVN